MKKKTRKNAYLTSFYKIPIPTITPAIFKTQRKSIFTL